MNGYHAKKKISDSGYTISEIAKLLNMDFNMLFSELSKENISPKVLNDISSVVGKNIFLIEENVSNENFQENKYGGNDNKFGGSNNAVGGVKNTLGNITNSDSDEENNIIILNLIALMAKENEDFCEIIRHKDTQIERLISIIEKNTGK